MARPKGQRKHLSTKGGKFNTALWREYRAAADEHGAQSAAAVKIRNTLVEQNRPLVLWQAEKFRAGVARHCDLQDLIQAGCIALIRVIERFNPNAGDNTLPKEDLSSLFVSFAIQHMISDFRRLSLDDHVVHKRPGDAASKAEKTRYRDMEAALGREPTREEYGPALRRVQKALTEPPLVEFTNGEAGTVFDNTPSDAPSAEEVLIRREDETSEFEALAALPAKTRLAVEMRILQARTYRQIARDLHISSWQAAEELVLEGLLQMRESLTRA